MEPVGLAVGVVGLAGLFSAVLEALDRVQDYKTSSADSKALTAQFNASRVQLEGWGRNTGLYPSLDQAASAPDARRTTLVHLSQERLSAIEELLKTACDIMGAEKSPKSRVAVDDPGLPVHNANQSRDVDGDPRVAAQRGSLGRAMVAGGASLTNSTRRQAESKRHRIGWAFGRKGERTEQVKLLGDIVNQLERLADPGLLHEKPATMAPD